MTERACVVHKLMADHIIAGEEEWKAGKLTDLDALELVSLRAQMKRVNALVEKWNNATNLETGKPSIIAKAMAEEVQRAIDGR